MNRLAYNLVGIAAALALWELAGRVAGADLFAPPSVALVEFMLLARQGQIFAELAGSLRQMVVGFALACAVGLPAGIAMGRSRVCDGLFHPWLSMFVVTSVAALVPLFVVVFGTGFWFRVAIVFVASVWYVMLTVYHGARGVEPRYIDVGRSFGAGVLRSFRSIPCRRSIPTSSPRCASASCTPSAPWWWPRCSSSSAMADSSTARAMRPRPRRSWRCW